MTLIPPQGGPWLWLEASGPQIAVGVLQDKRWIGQARASGMALELLPALIGQALEEAGLALSAVQGFLYGAGPGSVLGLRLSAVMLNSWRTLPQWAHTPLWAVPSMASAASWARLARSATDSFCVMAPAKKGFWNVWQEPSKTLEVLPEKALETLSPPGFHYPQRKLWQQAAVPAWATLLEPDWFSSTDWMQPELLVRVAQAEVPQPAANDYQRWDGTRHGA